MSGLFQIQQPYFATNIALNPSFESWASGGAPTAWVTTGTVNLVQSGAYFDLNCAQMLNTATLAQTMSGLTAGTPWQCSAYVNITSGSVTFSVQNGDGTGSVGYSLAGSTNGTWQRMEQGIILGGANTSLKVLITVSAGASVLIDGVQVESYDSVSTRASSYIDGDRPGCYWNGPRFTSTSSRSQNSTEGGRLLNFDQFSTYVESIKDFGMPPVHNVDAEYSLQDGGLWQTALYKPRTLGLGLKITGTSLQDLHHQRATLINALKSNNAPTRSQFYIRYLGTGTMPVKQLQVTYAGGLEGNLTGKNFVENTELKLKANDPYWYSVGSTTLALYNTATSTANGLFGRTNGTYNTFNGGVSTQLMINSVLTTVPGTIVSSAFNPNTGDYYFSGNFITVAGSSPSTPYNGVGKYNIYTGGFSRLAAGTGSPGFGGGVTGSAKYANAIAIDAQGNVYFGGSFPSAGGVTVNNMAKYLPASDTFTYVGPTATNNGVTGNPSGGNGPSINALTFDGSGILYVGGCFTACGGTSVTATNFAKLNGSTWLAAANTDTNVNGGAVYALALAPDGQIVLGGIFQQVGGVTAHVAKFNVTTGAITALATTGGVPINVIAVGRDNNIYVAGGFFSINGVSCNGIARFNGTAWYPLGGGLTHANGSNVQIGALMFDGAGNLYAGGDFDRAAAYVVGGVISTGGIAVWGGTEWRSYDTAFLAEPPPYSPPPAGLSGLSVNTMIYSPVNNGTYFFGGLFQTTIQTPSTNAVASPAGSADQYPSFTMTGPGILYNISNQSLGVTLNIPGGYTMQAGETLRLVLTPLTQSFTSSINGDILYKIQNSAIASFRLLGNPSANIVTVYLGGSLSAATSVIMNWQDRFLSMDGGA